MKLDDHIAKRFLTDPTMRAEIVAEMFPEFFSQFSKGEGIISKMRYVANEPIQDITQAQAKAKLTGMMILLETPKTHKPYYCTQTMLDCLNLLKIKKTGEHYNWTYFDKLPNQKATFIFPDNKLLRMWVDDEFISFVHLGYTPQDKQRGRAHWVMFYLNRRTGELCEHFGHPDVKNIERFIYALLCFIYMADNEEVLVPPHTRYGTRKAGKLINSTPFPITIINSRWNVTAIRTEGFSVSPHFAIRYTGQGRTIPRVVFIDQYEKSGYVRKGKPDGFGTNSLTQ